MTLSNFVKSLAVAAPLAAVAGGAHAGGFVAPVVQPAVAPIVETVSSDWAGAYVGGTLGYAFNGKDRVGVSQTPEGAVYDSETLKLSGANLGLRLGYRWQRDNWVYGPELGFEGGKIEDSFEAADGYSAKSEIKNVLALRFKTGYLVQPETLVYGIVGVARAKVDYQTQGTGAGGPIGYDDSFSRTGYILGLGVERQLSDRWSVTGEYEYANFGKERLHDGTTGYTRATPKYHNVKLGVNFRF